MTSEVPSPPLSPRSRALAVGLGAGVVLAVLDAGLTAVDGVSHWRPLTLAGAWCLVGAALGLCLAAVTRVVVDARRATIAGAVAFLPFALGVHATLFDGPAAARLPALPLLKGVVAGAILASGAVAARLAFFLKDRPLARTVVGLVWIATFTALHLTVYPRQYPSAHDVLLAHVAVGALFVGAAMPMRRALAVVPVLLVLAAAVGTSDPLLRPAASRLPLASRWLPPLLPKATPPPAAAPYVLSPWTDDRLASTRSLLQTAGMPSRPNILFVTIDALRVDRVAAYGAPTKLTPRLDALAEAGTVYTQCRAAATLTYWSVMSAFLGLRPDRIKLHPEPDALPILPRLLEDAGWRTWASFPKWGVFPDSEKASRNGPSSLGFGTTEDRDLTDAERVDLCIKWMRDHRESPKFGWLHFMAPHAPYRPRGGPIFGTSAARRYDAEILESDALLGTLVDRLVADGFAENTLIIVSADHGEEFGEHGAAFHGLTTYDHAARVPLVVAGPGIPAARHDAQVSLTDLAPSILHLAGLTTPKALDGRSWFVPDPNETPGRTIFIEQHVPLHGVDLRAVVRGRHKVVLDFNTRTHEIYDIAADPFETRNLAGAGLPEEPELLGVALAAPPPLDAAPDPEMSSLDRLASEGRGGIDRWGPLLLSPRTRLRARAVDALAALPEQRGRATLRWFAEAVGPASDPERLRALAAANPTAEDLTHPDPRFRLAYVMSTVREGPPKDPLPLLAHLSSETNRAVIHEILRATSWAKRPAPEDYLERIAFTPDETGLLATRILATYRVDTTGRAIPGKAVVDSTAARPVAIGTVGTEVNIPGSPTTDAALNWVLFWSTEDVSEIAVFATSNGAAVPVTVLRQEGIVGVAFRRDAKPLTLQALGNKIRPVFSAALRVGG